MQVLFEGLVQHEEPESHELLWMDKALADVIQRAF